MPKTRSIEMYIGFSNGDSSGSWTTDYVDIPADTPDDKIEQVAKEHMLQHLVGNDTVAFVGVYHIPKPGEGEEEE